jgi:hypothetical protein
VSRVGHAKRRRSPEYVRSLVSRTRSCGRADRRVGARLLRVLRTVGNPDHGGAESGEVVSLCIAGARRELPLLPRMVLGFFGCRHLRGRAVSGSVLLWCLAGPRRHYRVQQRYLWPAGRHVVGAVRLAFAKGPAGAQRVRLLVQEFDPQAGLGEGSDDSAEAVMPGQGVVVGSRGVRVGV